MCRSPASSAHLRCLLPSPSPHLIRPIPPLSIPSIRSLSSSPISDLACSISGELIKLATGGGESNCLDLSRHLSLHFSDVRFISPLLLEILNASPTSGRAAADLYRWVVRSRSFTPSDESLSYLLHFFGRRKDFKSFLNLVSDFKSAFVPKSFAATVDHLVRAGRGTRVVRFFDSMMFSSAAGLSVQSSMVTPFAGLKSTSAFPVTRKLATDFSQLPSNGGRVQCMKKGWERTQN